MPLQQVQPKALQQTTLYGIGGVNLRADERLVAEDYMTELVNFDMHVNDGVATTRRVERTIATLSSGVSMIKRAAGGVYAGADDGTLYRDWSQIDTGYGHSVSLEEYVRLNRREPTVYVAGESKMRRLRGNDIFEWGLERPGVPPVLSLTSDPQEAVAGEFGVEGTYSIVYTYVVKAGSALVLESNPSPSATIIVKQPLTFFSNPSAIAVQVTAPTDTQVTHVRVYRSQSGGVVHLFDREVQNNGTNQTITLFQPDNNLGAAVDEDNDPPITSSKFVIFQDRAWIADDVNVYWSKKFQPESWPQLNYLTVGNAADPIVSIISSRFGLGVFTRRRRFRILESVEGILAIGDTLPFFGGSTATFIQVPSPTERGGAAFRGVVDADEGVIYSSDDGIYVTDFTNLDQRVSDPIGSLFLGRGTENIKPVDRRGHVNSVLGVHDSKRIFSYTEAGGTANTKTAIFSSSNGKWAFYDVGVSAVYSDTQTGYLYLGSPDGTVGIYDDYSRSLIGTVAATLTTSRLHGGAPYLDKLLQYLYVAATVEPGDTLTATVYIDGELRSITSVVSNKKMKVPAALFGRDFRVKLSFEGTRECVIRGIELHWLPMRTV